MKSKIEIRKAVKNRKPTFFRKDHNKKVKIGKKWRKPSGHHNKFARHCKGKRRRLEVGYKSPKEIRYTNKEGLFEIIISNIKDLEKIKEKTQAAVIKTTVGLKKKIEIIKKAQEKGIKIQNVKNEEEILKRFKVKKKVEKKEEKVVKEEKKQVEEVKVEEKIEEKKKPVEKEIKEEVKKKKTKKVEKKEKNESK